VLLLLRSKVAEILLLLQQRLIEGIAQSDSGVLLKWTQTMIVNVNELMEIEDELAEESSKEDLPSLKATAVEFFRTVKLAFSRKEESTFQLLVKSYGELARTLNDFMKKLASKNKSVKAWLESNSLEMIETKPIQMMELMIPHYAMKRDVALKIAQLFCETFPTFSQVWTGQKEEAADATVHQIVLKMDGLLPQSAVAMKKNSLPEGDDLAMKELQEIMSIKVRLSPPVSFVSFLPHSELSPPLSFSFCRNLPTGSKCRESCAKSLPSSTSTSGASSSRSTSCPTPRRRTFLVC
jgi:hypothetical protein